MKEDNMNIRIKIRLRIERSTTLKVDLILTGAT